jgi:hypothetical protein
MLNDKKVERKEGETFFSAMLSRKRFIFSHLRFDGKKRIKRDRKNDWRSGDKRYRNFKKALEFFSHHGSLSRYPSIRSQGVRIGLICAISCSVNCFLQLLTFPLFSFGNDPKMQV